MSSSGELPSPLPSLIHIRCCFVPSAASDYLLWVLSPISNEVKFLKNSMGHGSSSDGDFAEARALISSDMMYAPEKGTYTSAAAASNSDRVSSLQVTFTAA